MNRKNIFQRYLFRKGFFWKVKEKFFFGLLEIVQGMPLKIKWNF